MILTILYAIIGFVILVFVHELGHFVFARLGGVAVEEFAVGMGKALWKKKRKNTLYRINLFPIGGYCKLKGQSDFGPASLSGDPDSFFQRPAWVRFMVSFGGPFFSYLLGFLFLTLSLLSQGELKINSTEIATYPGHPLFQDRDQILAVNGEKVSDWKSLQTSLLENQKKEVKILLNRQGNTLSFSYTPDMENPDFVIYANAHPKIREVRSASAAEKSGILAGDEVVSINETSISDEMDLKYLIQNGNLPLKIKLLRDQKEISREVTPETLNGKKLLGISFSVARPELEKVTQQVSYPFGVALKEGFRTSFNVISVSYKGILYLIRGDISFKENVSGPIKIFSSLGEAGSQGGIFSFLSFAGFISLALAFFNFLPFPALDGGHMVISLIEMIFRKKVSPKVINALQVVGIAFLLGMLLFVTVNDISKMFR